MSEQQNRANPMQVVRMEMNKMESEFINALPSHIPVERFMRVVMTAIQNNPDLLDCDRRSLWNSAMRAAQDGLLPDGREGAIVAYKRQAQWMPMVAGIRKKVRNSGEIATWDVQAVYENDAFDFELGDDPFIRHKPALSNRGKIIAVYSIATLKGGEKSRDVMSIEEVEKIRAISRASNGPWSNPTFYPEMAKKTVARRHSKVLPMSSDLDDLIRRDDHLYDLEGSSDAEVKGAAKGRLGARLAALADNREEPVTFDGETGEIKDTVDADSAKGKPAQQSKKSTASQGDDDFPGDRPNASDKQPDAGEIEHARSQGAEAFHRGQSRKATPQKFKATQALHDAWLEGFDAEDAGAENGQGGDA